MKIAIIGGAGFRSPSIYAGVVDRVERLGVTEVVLYDRDGRRLERIAAVIAGLDAERDRAVPCRTTEDLDDALEGADFVYCAVRVGGLEGRLADESVAIAEGMVGQETTGPGGICFALRTVPAIVEIAERAATRAPDAWFVNFTNPAGLVTEAAQRILGERAIGICDAPPNLFRRLARVLGRPERELWFHYFGLNHLGWVSAVVDRGRDRLPELLEDDRRIAETEEGQLFGGEWLRTLGLWPNEYLYYYYANREVVAELRASGTRAAYLVDQQRAFYEANGSPADALAAWRVAKGERESTYLEEAWRALDVDAERVAAAREADGGSSYADVALDLLEALTGGGDRVLVLNVANRGSLPYLDAAAVVEVPCVVTPAGAQPIAMGDAPLEVKGLIQEIKAVDRATIDAALQGSRRLALRALALHPLVPSVESARRVLARYLEEQPTLRGRLT
jgi:6-phospho-beta-glucosidase